VLRAMTVPYTSALGAFRFSFSHENISRDVARVLEVLPAIVEKAREVSQALRQIKAGKSGSGQHLPEQRGWRWLFLLKVST
jgi:hypothetical protein